MSAARDLLRDLWRVGVRVELAGNRFRLVPANVAPEPLRDALREHRAEVQAMLEQLPAGGRCPICGDPTGWPEKTDLPCVACMQAGIDRVLATLPPKGDISPAAQEGARYAG